MIPDSFKQDLLNRVDIVDVVSRCVQLKKGGANFQGLCPFHSEKTPSFTVSPAKQFYHCFGCGAHGNAIGFLMAYSSLGYVDAVKELAASVGLQVPDERPRTPEEAARKEREPDLYAVMGKAMDFYRAELKKSPRAIEYLKGRPFAPTGPDWDAAVAYWKTLKSDPGAKFDREVTLRAAEILPQVSWGTSPEMVVPVDGEVPDPEREKDAIKREGMERALQYMGLKPRTKITDIKLDKVFIGSCTNSRIEDLRAAAAVVKGRRIASNIRLALVVPGSGLVKSQAEREGLDRVFRDAGFEWRQPGCSMCLGMNPDRLDAGERCASTSNRNFEGRQGAGGRTHLVSPAMAAAAAIAGHFVDVRELY